MNKSTLDKIKAAALYLEDLLAWEDEILKVAEYVAEPSHKRLLKNLIKFLDKETPNKLDPPVQMGYEILKLLQTTALTNEEIAAKIGKSAESVKQAIAALKAGGIVLQETTTGKFQATGRPRKMRGISK